MAKKVDSDKPFVSVVMTVLNMERTIDECLESLVHLDYPKNRYEIIVVDGKSKDGTRKIVENHIQKTKSPTISLYEKEGLVGVGRNEAFKHAKGEIVAITDGDMVVPPDWLDNLVFEFEEGVGGVGGPNDNADTSLITTAIGCIDVQGPSNDVVPIRGKNPYKEPFVSSTNVYTTVCRNSVYKKSILDEIKGFDERIISSDDPELNIKILKKGYKLKYTPKALVKHHHRSSISGFYKQQRRYAVSQAIVNKIHPELYRHIQPLPFLAFIGLIYLFFMSIFIPILIHLPIFMIAGYVLFWMGYGLKCAMAKKNFRLLFLIPLIVVAWHWAWIVHYPKGMIYRKRVISADWDFIKKFSKMY
jgi:cellulose synthase/poly-beta-1,6-N-acetylglucosamine synthase-like glycosyltransferase